MTKPTYTIVAGINGAGKSTLFLATPSYFAGTQRINADEILRSQAGDWRDSRAQLRAMRENIHQIKQALASHTSFHTETTLAGNGKTQLDFIHQAHELGFDVTLLYVTLASAALAIDRVNHRVQKGGHGIPADVIKRRYDQSLTNLPTIAAAVDNVEIIDNSTSTGLTLIYAQRHPSSSYNQLANYPWLPTTFSEA